MELALRNKTKMLKYIINNEEDRKSVSYLKNFWKMKYLFWLNSLNKTRLNVKRSVNDYVLK